MNIEWPVVYLQESKDEELMYISFDDWTHDVDSHYAIGSLNNEDDHYLVDVKENVYRLSNPYITDSGYPHFEIEKQRIVELVKVRAKNQLDVIPEDFSSLIEELNY